MNFDDIFGMSSKDKLQQASVIARMRDVINEHSRDLKRLVEKIKKLEERLKELEGETK